MAVAGAGCTSATSLSAWGEKGKKGRLCAFHWSGVEVGEKSLGLNWLRGHTRARCDGIRNGPSEFGGSDLSSA